MVKKIVILGSTGSIGKTLIKILKREKNKIKIELISTNKNYKLALKQSISLNIKNIIIADKSSYTKAKKHKLSKNINIYNDFKKINKIFKTKVDYSMIAITGIDGLDPTLKIIKFTKKIAIANKEGIISGWNLISKEIKKYQTEFIPVDSEHFSIWYSLSNKTDTIKKIFLTASGGPFYNYSVAKFKKISVKDALKHPNWKMGRKITIDSSTLMNKVFEVIEAKKIFNIDYDKIDILIHPKSYIHGIIKYTNGMTQIVAHNTSMEIPISCTLNTGNHNEINSKEINLKAMNNLSLQKVDKKKFPTVKIIKTLPNNNSLFETILVSANDEFVNLFLNEKISYLDIFKKLYKFINLKEFAKYKKIEPKSVEEIIKLHNYVRLKIQSMV